MALLGLVAATLPDFCFAQSSPLIGTWKLNPDKSKFGPGAALRSGTGNFEQDGQNIRPLSKQSTRAATRRRVHAHL
jgi:hypothetical protein